MDIRITDTIAVSTTTNITPTGTEPLWCRTSVSRLELSRSAEMAQTLSMPNDLDTSGTMLRIHIGPSPTRHTGEPAPQRSKLKTACDLARLEDSTHSGCSQQTETKQRKRSRLRNPSS